MGEAIKWYTLPVHSHQTAQFYAPPALAFKFIFQAVALLIFTCTSLARPAPQAATLDHSLETVSLCQLTEHWEKYDHKIVRIEVIYHTSNEVSQVYDPGCATSDQTAWVKLLPYGSPSPVPIELEAKLSQLLKKNGRARITVVGEFDGPKKVEIPPDLSPEAAAAFRAGGSRYGHMNGWKFQFVFSRVEKVEPVPAGDPWPTWSDQKKR